MRCYCCNNVLKPSESTRKFKESGTYTEMCDKCLGTISDEVDTIEGEAMDAYDDGEEEDDG